MWPRIIPFLTYMLFIGIGEGIQWMGSEGSTLSATLMLWLYPIKIAAVGCIVVWLWNRYEELRTPILTTWQEGALTILTGVGVYLFWVRLDAPWAVQGASGGYNPFEGGGSFGPLFAGIRIFGAAIVVPVMEELFWRSFLLRYVINARFETIPLGTFTLNSFLICSVLFGLEHHEWFAGLLAGAAYSGLAYYSKRLWPCVLAHGLTNLLLGIHVLITGEWKWW